MDMRSWKKVLLQWITECGFMERHYFNIEQSDIDAFYRNFSQQHPKTANGKCKRLSDFLKEFYPQYEAHVDDENCLSSSDYIYIYSMLLHFCCVKNPETVFHEICQRLPEYAQQCIASFFKELLDKESLTKEALRHAIAHVVTTHVTSPQLNESFSSNQSASGIGIGMGGGNAAGAGSISSYSLPSPNFSRCDSPLKTPKRSAGTQRISPTTPKSYLLEERTRELYNLRAQLETERYEKGILEVQIKQNEDKILQLNHDHKKLIQKIQDLKNDILLTTSDGGGSTNREGDEIKKRLLKELTLKENEIIKLNDVVRTLHEEKVLVQEKLSYAEKQIVMCMNRMRDLDFKVDELSEEIEKKNGTIKYLTDSKMELEQFINETRSNNMRPDLNGSMECFDASFSRNIGNTNTSSNVSSPENLGASVVDVQLREKEHENSKLKEELESVKEEHKRLAKNLHDLAEKQAKEFDIVIEQSVSMDESVHEVSLHSDDPLEQFNIFSHCMEKICSYHKTEKNKVTKLEEEAQKLQATNEGLTKNLAMLSDDMEALKDSAEELQKHNEELIKDKEIMLDTMDKCRVQLDQIKRQKEDLYTELQNTISAKDDLSDNLENMREQLELSNKTNIDLMENNEYLKQQCDAFQIKHTELQEQLLLKTSEINSEMKDISERLGLQSEEIKTYIAAELVMKQKFEQLYIENEGLKKKSRDADKHLLDMKQVLIEKQTNITKLAEEVVDFTDKNKQLEEKIDCIIQEYQEDKFSHETNHQHKIDSLDEEINRLQTTLDETRNIVVNKTQANEEMAQLLDELTAKIKDILNFFAGAIANDNCLQNALNLEQQVKNILQENSDSNAKLNILERAQLDSSNKIDQLQQDIDEKNKALVQHAETYEEMIKLRNQVVEYEDKIDKHKEKQTQFIEKVKMDLNKKEDDLNSKMKQAANEYQASLDRIGVELKLEQEHHNNKERELLLVIAEHNDVKKQLIEKEREVEKIMETNKALQEQNKKFKLFEARVSECSKENNQLQQEIESFKQEVHQNALRLLEADKALTELFVVAKEHEINKGEILKLQKTIDEKENVLQSQLEAQRNLELQLQEQSESISNLSATLNKYEQDKAELSQQIQNEQEEKTLLLDSLEKSADQLKSMGEEKDRLSASMEHKYNDIKEQLDNLTMQNTKIQGDLVERDAELRMSQEDHEQERERFEQKLSQLSLKMAESSEQLESFDMALMEILAIMENNFNLKREIQLTEVKNLFNAQISSDIPASKLNQLRGNLNLLLHFDIQLQSQLKELTLEQEETLCSLEAVRKSNGSLQLKITQQNNDIKELKEQVENEEIIVQRRVSQEIRRLEDDLLNLEKVNERLVNGNFDKQVLMGNLEQDLKYSKDKLDKLEEEKLKLKEEICTKTKVLEKLQQEDEKLQQTIKSKSQQLEKITEKCKLLESQHKEKSTKLQSLNKEHQELKEKSQKQQQKIDQQQHQLHSLQTEQKKLNEKLKQLGATNDSLETEVSAKTKEFLGMSNKYAELLQSLKNIEQQLLLTTQKLDESETLKLNSETSCQQIQSDSQQLQRDMDFLKAQLQSSSEENQRLCKEIESLKQDKVHLREEIRDTRADIQRANDNVTQLIQQISSIRLEKEAAMEENLLLRKQLEESGKHHSSSETKLKSIIEKSQDFERKLLAAENELKSAKANLEKCETNSEKLCADNTKLKGSQEAATKRIEKLSVKLGDSQARSTKLERDNEKLSKTLEANITTVEALQKEKDLLQNEAKSLKERLSRAERAQEQLAAKVQNLEHLNSQLQETKQKLEASEIDGKSKLNKLEKMRESNEDKIRKLANSLNNAEHANVKLNLEIGALNSQLQEVRSLHTQDQVQELAHKLETAQQDCTRHEEMNASLQLEVENLKEEKTVLSDQLSKVSLTLQITKQNCEKLCSEMEQIRSELLIIREEKMQAQFQHESSSIKLKDMETQNDHLLYERKNLVTSLEVSITSLEEQLASKCNEVDSLQQEIQSLRESSESHSSLIQQSVSANQSEIEHLRSKLSLADEARQKEQELISQLKLDNQILHTKYQESKQRALDAAKNSEERIKENRLELEGKLEKMKNKMKTLYTEEITKMKTKQEREVVIIKSEMEVVKAQNSKYDEHIRKLSSQIVRLNEKNLEYQKENTILATKLEYLLKNHDNEKFKRPSSIHVSTISSSTGPPVSSANIGTNLAMEDEEGEVFNNTYLTDLKTGRISEYMSREVCGEELKYRNSLLPPHLRSAYAAQFDHEFTEDELKDGPSSLDDSMSALLSTTAGGTRKKCTGVTHYKRPGPPTPSKNGRLSFGGGSSEPMREILKESFDGNSAGAVSSSSKTPARFNFFASRFSMGTGKDEKPQIKQEPGETNQRKTIQKKPPQSKVINRRLLSGVVCTSTPRKSKLHYDQRRLLDQLLTSSPSPSPLAKDPTKTYQLNKKITPPDVSLIETPLSIFEKHEVPKAPSRKQNAKRIEAIAAGLKNKRRNSSMYGRRLSRRLQEICTPTSGETTSSAFSNTPKDRVRRQTISSVTTTSGDIAGKTAILQKRLRKKPQKDRGTRPSLNLRGNMFAKYRNPNRIAQHDLNKYKSRKQRFDHFNLGRDLKTSKLDSADDDTIIKNLTYDIANNNYATFNHNQLGETMVIAKGKDFKIEEEETFVCASEIFETHDTEDLYSYDDDYLYDAETDSDEDVETDIKYDIPLKKETCKQELITSFDLEQFDRYVSGIAKVKKEPDEYSPDGSSRHFEKILLETESSAPFEIKQIHFNASSNFSQYSRKNTSSSPNRTTTLTGNLPQQSEAIGPIPHISPNSSPGNVSRVIYGGTVIYNRRLPNINTTYVRKSSIYVKNNNQSISDSTACNDVILITNQTITMADLARMWKQMDGSARVIVSFAALASFTTLLGLFLSFCSKR